MQGADPDEERERSEEKTADVFQFLTQDMKMNPSFFVSSWIVFARMKISFALQSFSFNV